MADKVNACIGAWLLKEGHTREQLAEAINISRPALANRLNGSSKWKWEEVVRVAQITESSLNELAGIGSASF